MVNMRTAMALNIPTSVNMHMHVDMDRVIEMQKHMQKHMNIMIVMLMMAMMMITLMSTMMMIMLSLVRMVLVLMDRGKVQVQGPPDELMRSSQLLRELLPPDAHGSEGR